MLNFIFTRFPRIPLGDPERTVRPSRRRRPRRVSTIGQRTDRSRRNAGERRDPEIPGRSGQHPGGTGGRDEGSGGGTGDGPREGTQVRRDVTGKRGRIWRLWARKRDLNAKKNHVLNAEN